MRHICIERGVILCRTIISTHRYECGKDLRLDTFPAAFHISALSIENKHGAAKDGELFCGSGTQTA